MSKAVSYAAVCIVSFLIGGFVFQSVGKGEAKPDGPQPGEASKSAPEDKNVPSRSFAIEGMTCQGCVDTVTSAIQGIPGVKSVNVSLADKKVVVSADDPATLSEKILSAIATAGYQAKLTSGEESKPAAVSAKPESTGKPPIFVNITRGKNELHAVSMAVGLAQSALKDGREATVFLNVDAPVFAAKDLGDDVQFADFPPVKKMLAEFLENGGQVLVCKHCAHIVKLEEGNLLDKAKFAAHGQLFSALPPGTIVFSY
jgi:copper chaperone CopZ/predicted peroxiredoxin